MKLYEFFGRPVNLGKKENNSEQDISDHKDELFWYILDHDKLHKDHAIPLLVKMTRDKKAGKLNRSESISSMRPIVEKGCMEFYHKKEMKGKPAKHFPKDLRDDLCERLCDHYLEAINKNEFQLGDD
jgi:hypothetical protein